MRKVLLGSAVLAMVGALLFGAAVPAQAEHLCDPEPVGRCGTVQRESAYACFYMDGPAEVSSTETNVITFGQKTPDYVSFDGSVEGDVYIFRTPAENFAGDPWEAPLPRNHVFAEANTWPGLQVATSQCAWFLWFAECEPMQWMKASTPVQLKPDFVVA